ncbi:hypothetical protein C2G38_13384 [Gigaspora rosea]|uniref:Uncharacterized protein n=1 Tax=Gigaspora rosea TaxID=44941 RepID=A0A397UV51_9GLOM|nr:hypothetical protein C2G38_13384 [Gigaspora rosea]
MCLEKREADSKRLGKIWEHICKIAPRVAETSASTSENSSLDEAFSSIPPPVTYAPDASVSTGVTHVGGFWPLKKVERWSEFRTNVANFDFSGEAKFRAPAFCDGISVRVESDVDTAVGVNICKIMNQLLGPQFVFGKQKNSNFGQDPTISRIIPDYTCRYFSNDDDAGQIIFPIEVVKGLINDEGLSLESTHARDSLRQIYNYMIAVESQYGVLSSYNYHWFLQRPKESPTDLNISEAIPLASTNPTVLKAYANFIRLEIFCMRI